MDPYGDPDCGCAMYTTFTGTLEGDVIEGQLRFAHGSRRHVPGQAAGDPQEGVTRIPRGQTLRG